MPVAKPKKAEKAELQRFKEHAYKSTLYQVYSIVKKQLASYQTTVNGDNPHYHFFEIDSAGNGTTHGTINTGIDIQEVDPHDHNIKKWVVSSAKKHIHAIDVVMKDCKRGRPKKVHAQAPSRALFKTFEEYHKAMKKYLKKPTRRPMAKGTHLTKSYLEKVMSRVLKMMVDKQGKPVGSISERRGGRYKKVAPGKWVKMPPEKGKKETPAEEGERAGRAERYETDDRELEQKISLTEERITELERMQRDATGDMKQILDDELAGHEADLEKLERQRQAEQAEEEQRIAEPEEKLSEGLQQNIIRREKQKAYDEGMKVDPDDLREALDEAELNMEDAENQREYAEAFGKVEGMKLALEMQGEREPGDEPSLREEEEAEAMMAPEEDVDAIVDDMVKDVGSMILEQDMPTEAGNEMIDAIEAIEDADDAEKMGLLQTLLGDIDDEEYGIDVDHPISRRLLDFYSALSDTEAVGGT